MHGASKPNVLILYTDQQRWDAVGVNDPDGIVQTPHLDRLAAEGASFDHCFVQNAVCMPSRMSMLTGQYPSSLGIGCNGIPMPENVTAVHQMLKPYGYHTANIGKLHFLPHSNRDHRCPHPDYGFDHLMVSDEPGCYRDPYRKWVENKNPEALDDINCGLPPARALWEQQMSWHGTADPVPRRDIHADLQPFSADDSLSHPAFVADETIRYLRQNKDNTFFGIAGFYAPHPPLMPSQRFLDLYNAADMRLPYLGTNDEPAKSGFSDEDWRRIRHYYYAYVSLVDFYIGRILDELAALGLAENTLVIFTSDHGEHLGDHGRFGKGAPGYDSAARVPLIVRCPDATAAGKRYTTFAEALDIVPTILDYAGVQQPPFVQGKSLRPLLEGKTADHRDSVYCEHKQPHRSTTRMVRNDSFMYCATWSGETGEVTEELYDLQADPHQLENVAAMPQYGEARSSMHRLLIQRMLQAENPMPAPVWPY